MTITETGSPSFLIISGQVAANKKIELEHSFRIGFRSMSRACISKSLSEDFSRKGLYYFFSVWPDNESLRHFMSSPEYQLLHGAFRALGDILQIMQGNIECYAPKNNMKMF
jgi:quinol monooxygenase YgiN